jgi:tetratricopeptide (TPR) repeat protein
MMTVAQQEKEAAEHIAARALPLLDAALQARPDDAAVLRTRAQALRNLGRMRESMEAYEAALARSTDRKELLLRDAAETAGQLGKWDVAVDYWRQAVALNPWFSGYQSQYARALAERQEWSKALGACAEAIRLNPARRDARLLLVQYHLQQNNLVQARTEFDNIMALTPKDEQEQLRRLIEPRLRR